MSGFFHREALKAIQWELAKGYLRSLAAIDGAQSTGEMERPYRFERIQQAVEKFIKEFEDEGFHE